MSDSQEEISTEPGLARPGGTSSPSPEPSSHSPRSWLKALTALFALGFTAARVFPKMLEYFDRALEAIDHASVEGRTVGWMVWIPSIVLALIVVGSLIPTSYRDLGGALGAVGGLLDKVRGLLPGKGGK